jgi:hypothetical protein
MKGIDVHPCLGENRRLRERRGVSVIVHLGIDGRPLGLGRVPQRHAEKVGGWALRRHLW